jgi:hypothetical protein
MTDYDISELRREIRSLSTAVSDLGGKVASVDRLLDSLNSKLRQFWFEFFSWGMVCMPLIFMLAIVIKHM